MQTGISSRKSEGGAQACKRRTRLRPARGGSRHIVGGVKAGENCDLWPLEGGAGRGRGLGRLKAGGPADGWMGRASASPWQRERSGDAVAEGGPAQKGWGLRW